MKKIFKCAAAVAAAAAIALTPALAGCTQISYSSGGTVSIRDVYEEVKAETGNEELTFLEFLEEYLGYSGSQAEELASLKSTINRSMLSAVSVLADFSVPAQPPFAGADEVSSVGSGVIIDIDKQAGDMYVVTNAHVVFYNGAYDEFSTDVSVYLFGYEYESWTENGQYYFSEGQPVTAEVIGASLTYDIAVLKVADSDLVRNSYAVAAEWTDEEEIDIGETVYAIGNPLDEALGATTGIVSRQSQNISIDMYDTDDTSDDFNYRVMRTDVPINEGNSGGGLFDSDGKIVGIVNAKTIGEDVDSMSYAIPASVARRAAENMISAYERTGQANTYISRPVIGVTVTSNGTAPSVDEIGIVSVEELASVSSIQPGSIMRGLLEENDILTNIALYNGDEKVEDVKIVRIETISEVLLAARVGYTLELTVLRADSSAEEGMAELTFSAEIPSNIFSSFI